MKLKKIALSLVFLLIFPVIFAACGGDAGGYEKVTLTFWNPITGPDGAYVQKLIYDFNKEHKNNIEIKMQSLPEAEYYTKIIAGITDKDLPDVAMLHQVRLAQFVRSGILQDMTQYCESNGYVKEDYFQGAWEAGVFDGKIYALPYDILPMALYYNKEMIPAGYTENDIAQGLTFAKFLQMAAAATDKSASSSKDHKYGISFNYAYTHPVFSAFLTQLGGKVVSSDEPAEPLFGDAKGVRAAQYLKDIISSQTVSGSGVNHISIFVQGRALFTMDGVWTAPEFSNVNYGIVPLPIVAGKTSKGISDGHSFVRFKNNQESTEARENAFSVFIKYMTDKSGYWAESGKLPALRSVAGSEAYRALPWAPLSDKLEALVSPDKVYTYSVMMDHLAVNMSKVCEGTLQPAAAVAQAVTDSKQAIAAMS
jgi:multiple sugar transport system substrate-binding protein